MREDKKRGPEYRQRALADGTTEKIGHTQQGVGLQIDARSTLYAAFILASSSFVVLAFFWNRRGG